MNFWFVRIKLCLQAVGFYIMHTLKCCWISKINICVHYSAPSHFWNVQLFLLTTEYEIFEFGTSSKLQQIFFKKNYFLCQKIWKLRFILKIMLFPSDYWIDENRIQLVLKTQFIWHMHRNGSSNFEYETSTIR